MSRRIVILDVSLLLLLIFGVAKLRQDWRAFEPAHQVSSIQPKAEKLPALPAASGEVSSVPADWTEIPTHNPFSFDRSDIAILAAPAEPPKPMGTKPILFGTMTLGDGWIAMLASGQPNNRNSHPLRVGESIDGWKIVEISDKAVVVDGNSNRETIVMNDPTVPIQRDPTRTLASTVSAAQSVQSIAPVSAVPATSAAPAASTSAPNSPPGAPCVREIRTPFGIVRQPCDDSRR